MSWYNPPNFKTMKLYPLKTALKCILTTFILFISHTIGYSQAHPVLEEFKNPGKEYSIVPFWSWNGTLEGEELKRQMDLMMDKGIYGAFMHARAGINYGETPYFSEGWWDAVETTVTHASQIGFSAWLYDEDKWPSGSAGGRTIARNPDEFVKKGLKYNITRLDGPQSYEINTHGALRIFAVKMTGDQDFDRETQLDLTSIASDHWEVPTGDWSIIRFEVIKDNREAPVTHIDYLDSNAVAAFIEITNEEYHKRFGEYFGNTIPGVFFDEIFFNDAIFWDEDPGDVLSWTDDFAESFMQRKGYDLLGDLPSLVLDSDVSVDINYDYFEELTYRYDNAWFRQYANWCEQHGIALTGHTMEEFHAYLYEGDYLKTIGRLQMPGTDNEDFRYNYPRYIKWFKPRQLSSATSIYGRKYAAVEAMGGGGYFITPEEYRYGMARMGVCGINFIIPHFFHYSIENLQGYTDWPPSWFFRNPYWKYFRPLADFGRRISYMNTIGSPVSHVAILFPLSEQWASGQNGEVDNRHYLDLQEDLLNNHMDYNIINDDAFLQADVNGGRIRIHDANYRVLILPSMNTLTVETAQKIKEFYEDGGMVIASEKIPTASVHGHDPEIRSMMNSIFGIHPELAGKYYDVEPATFQPFTYHENENDGMAYYTKTLSPLPDILAKNIPAELELLKGKRTALRFHQRRKDDLVYYLLMNEEKQENIFRIRIPDYGVPYWMDPESGVSRAVENYLSTENELIISLSMGPWEAGILALLPGEKDNKKIMIASTTLEEAGLEFNEKTIRVSGWADPLKDHAVTVALSSGAEYTRIVDAATDLQPFTLEGPWDFQPVRYRLDNAWSDRSEEDTLEVPVMRFFVNHDKLGWDFKQKDFDDSHFPIVKITDLFNEKKGVERSLDGWNASRIIYYDLGNHFPQIGGQDVEFRKSFHLEKVPAKAEFRITADPAYTLLVNGRELGSDNHLETVETYDLAPLLKTGNNEILIEVTGHRGLIAEGIIHTGKDPVMLHTNGSWEVRYQGIWEPAIIHSKPPLGSWEAADIQFRKTTYPLECWYRKELPVGTVKLLLPERSGGFEFFIDGLKQKVSGNSIDLADQSMNSTLSVKAVLKEGDLGMLAPIKAVCSRASVELKSWEDLGLEWYTGRAIYSREFMLPPGFKSKDLKIILDPGKVNWFAEIWMNGELVNQGPWGDYQTDVTTHLKKGKNNISIVVSNLKANEAIYAIPDATLDDTRNRWWQQGATLREKERLESGLLGPVRLIPHKFVTEELELNH